MNLIHGQPEQKEGKNLPGGIWKWRGEQVDYIFISEISVALMSVTAKICSLSPEGLDVGHQQLSKHAHSRPKRSITCLLLTTYASCTCFQKTAQTRVTRRLFKLSTRMQMQMPLSIRWI